MGEPNTAASSATANVDGGETKRGKSTIAFVYTDLESALALVSTLYSKGGTTCAKTQLAAWMNQSVGGGTFRSLLNAARSFGLIDVTTGSVTLTALGRSAIDSNGRQGALVEAFLNIPLHSVMYANFEGNSLPPPAAIERQMVALGVPAKQKERARQTFMKSAQFAGFIDPPTGRIIRPATAPGSPSPDPKNKRNGGDGGGKDQGLDLDPLLMALLLKIPAVDEGWPKEQRLRWFRTFAMNVSQIYDTGDEVVDLAIKIESKDS